MLIPGHRIAGRYRLDRKLAQGGMGSVWVAHDTQLGRDVAIKVMSPAAFGVADLVTRFDREAKSAAQLRSAHVAQIFDHGVDAEQPFIVMELLEGEDLSARLRRAGRLSLDATAKIAGDVCKALRRAHEMGIVHRDLKPANIFLARQDDDEVVKILDFGVVKLTAPGSEMTNSKELLGTPHYMAPEQARKTSVPVDHRADLWALGVIAFRAITGQLPFPGLNAVEVLVNVTTRPPPPPSSIVPELGADVDRFFEIALARDPEARFQSALAFREAITRLASPGASAARMSSPSGWDLTPAQAGSGTVLLTAPVQARASTPPALAPMESVTVPLMPAQGAPPSPAQTAPLAPPAQTAPLPSPIQTAPLPSPIQTAPLPQAAQAPPSPQGPASAPPAPRRAGVHIIVWGAAAASVIVLGVVVFAALSQRSADPSSGAAQAPIAAPAISATAISTAAISATAEPSAAATVTAAPTEAPAASVTAAPSSAPTGSASMAPAGSPAGSSTAATPSATARAAQPVSSTAPSAKAVTTAARKPTAGPIPTDVPF